MKLYLVAMALALASPSQAKGCTRFMHNYAGVIFELFGSGTTEEKTVLVFPDSGPNNEDKIYIRTVCDKQEYTCFRNIDDKSDTIEWRYVPGEDYYGKPTHVFVEDADRAGLAWKPACDLLDEFAREDAKKKPLILPLPR